MVRHTGFSWISDTLQKHGATHTRGVRINYKTTTNSIIQQPPPLRCAILTSPINRCASLSVLMCTSTRNCPTEGQPSWASDGLTDDIYKWRTCCQGCGQGPLNEEYSRGLIFTESRVFVISVSSVSPMLSFLQSRACNRKASHPGSQKQAGYSRMKVTTANCGSPRG